MGKKPGAKSLEAAKEKKEKPVKADSKEVVAKAKKKPAVEALGKAAPCADKCQIKSCKREYRAKGYCNTHYRKWRQGEYGIARYKTCRDVECKKPLGMNRHGYCEDHYQNYYVKGVEIAKAVPAEKAAEKPAEKKESAA